MTSYGTRIAAYNRLKSFPELPLVKQFVVTETSFKGLFRYHKLKTRVMLHLKDELHPNLQNARRIVASNTTEDTRWIDRRGNCAKV
jgi:hypothetical protein